MPWGDVGDLVGIAQRRDDCLDVWILGGNKMEAAEMLGVYRPTLYSKIKKYHLQKDTPASS